MLNISPSVLLWRLLFPRITNLLQQHQHHVALVAKQPLAFYCCHSYPLSSFGLSKMKSAICLRFSSSHTNAGWSEKFRSHTNQRRAVNFTWRPSVTSWLNILKIKIKIRLHSAARLSSAAAAYLELKSILFSFVKEIPVALLNSWSVESDSINISFSMDVEGCRIPFFFIGREDKSDTCDQIYLLSSPWGNLGLKAAGSQRISHVWFRCFAKRLLPSSHKCWSNHWTMSGSAWNLLVDHVAGTEGLAGPRRLPNVRFYSCTRLFGPKLTVRITAGAPPT